MINKPIVEQRFKRSLATYNIHAIVQSQMARQLVEVAVPYIKHNQKVFEIGCGAGTLTSLIVKQTQPNLFIGNDIVANTELIIKDIVDAYKLTQFDYLIGDAETIDFPNQCDVIWSGATMQWFTQPIEFYNKAYNALSNGGILAFSTFGPNNFKEIETVTGNKLAYSSDSWHLDTSKQLFECLYHHQYEQVLWFDHPNDVLKHIKLTGVGGLNPRPWGKQQLNDFKKGYEQFYTPNKGYSLTYQPIIMVKRKIN